MKSKVFLAIIILIAIATEVAIAQTQTQDQVARQQVARLADGTKDLAGGLTEEAKKRQALEGRLEAAEKAIEEKVVPPPVVKTTVSGLTLRKAKETFMEIGGASQSDLWFFDLIIVGFSPEQAEVEIKKYIVLLEPGKVKANEKARRALIAGWAEKAKSSKINTEEFATKNFVSQQIQLETTARREQNKNLSESQKKLESGFNTLSNNYNGLKTRLDTNEKGLDDLRGDMATLAEEIDSNAKAFEKWKTATDATLKTFGAGIYDLATGLQGIAQAQMYEEGKMVNKPFGSAITGFLGRDKTVQKTVDVFSEKARAADSLAGTIMAKYAKYRHEPAPAEPEE